MHRITLAVASAAAIVLLSYANAGATDYYPVRQRAQMDRPVTSVQPYNWTGFYAGGVAGYGFGSANSSNVDTGFGAVGVNTKTRGATVGGTIGYNYQIGSVVFGLEGDLSLANIKGAGSTDFLAWGWLPVNASTNSRVNWLGTARGRLGYAFDNVLLYGTGGYAFGGGNIAATVNFFGSPLAASNQDVGLRGWTLGGGVEWAFARNWSAKLEYLHLDLGSASTTMQTFGTPTVISTRFKDDIVRVGLNYKF